jgi:hypothetical protein
MTMVEAASNLCVRCTLSLLLLSILEWTSTRSPARNDYEPHNRFSITKDNIETCLLEWMVDFGPASFTIIRLLLVTDCPSLPVLVATLLRRNSLIRALLTPEDLLSKLTPSGLLRRISVPSPDSGRTRPYQLALAHPSRGHRIQDNNFFCPPYRNWESGAMSP